MFSILTVLVAVGVFSSTESVSSTCDVGELEAVAPAGLCNGGAVNQAALRCKDYCSKKYGPELVDSQCSDARSNGKRECICKLKCFNSGCWGDPHCWSCDGVKFGYQGLKKHYMVKPMAEYKGYPYFEIRQVNKVYQQGPMAIIDESEIIISDWAKIIQLKTPGGQDSQYALKIDGMPQSIPYRESKLEDYRELFIDIYYEDKAKTVVVLKTSFGLRVIYSTHVWNNVTYSDISVDLPRHPEIKGKLHGLLGRCNDNPDDDVIDAYGNKRSVDEKFSWDFGDSWIVPGAGHKTLSCKRLDAEDAYDRSLRDIDPVLREKARKLCRDNLENPQLVACAKQLGRPVPSVEDCFTDLINLGDEECNHRQYLTGLLQSMGIACGQNITLKAVNEEPRKSSSSSACSVALVPLYRLVSKRTGDHFYTTSYEEVINFMKTNGVVTEGISGYVAINGTDCRCNETAFKPAYRLYRPVGATDDHFYTMNEKEAADTAAKYGYKREGIAFYCPTTPDQCGATVSFHRFFRGVDHHYTTDMNEGKKMAGIYEGVLCYIWPNPGPVKQ